MRFIFITLWTVISLLAGGQEETTRKAEPVLTVSAGLLAGERNAEAVFQLGGGIRFSRFQVGLGAGVDWYQFVSYPVFADLRFFTGKRRQLFVYANPGLNLIAKKDPEGIANGASGFSFAIEGKHYLDMGGGYRFRMGKNNSFSLSGGWNEKRIDQVRTWTNGCGVAGCTTVSSERKRYVMKRVIVRMLFDFALR